MPLHWQEKDLASKHISLLKATMSNWILTAAEKWCLPVVEKMPAKPLRMALGSLLIQKQYHYPDEELVE